MLIFLQPSFWIEVLVVINFAFKGESDDGKDSGKNFSSSDYK